jgi:GNAT superfamily N-acetyltransferase
MNNLGTYTTPTNQTLTLRLVEPGDVPLLVEMFNRLSPETKRLRFHLYTARIPEEHFWQEARVLAALDPQRQIAIMATAEEDDGQDHAVGVARFVRATPADTDAEIAIVIRDDYQRKGLGKYLLRRLADQARGIGITHFSAWIMAENVRLMKLVEGMELKNMESETRHGERKIRVPL